MGITGVKVIDKEVIKSGTKTIVKNETRLVFNNKFWDSFFALLELLTDEGTAADIRSVNFDVAKFVPFVHFGVAKLHPDDTYDELKGKVVASKKAELKGLKDVYKLLDNAEDLLIEMLMDIAIKRHRLLKRQKSLSESLLKD